MANVIATYLTSKGSFLKEEILTSLKSNGVNATGKLAGSINYKILESGDNVSLIIEGEEYWSTIDPGQAPKNLTDLSKLRSAIRVWLDYKPFSSNFSKKKKDSLSFIIAGNINKKGTAQYRGEGRYTRVFSSIFNKDLEEEIKQEIIALKDSILILK